MNKSIKLRLIVMNILQWAVWGSYLTSMGSYLASVGLGSRIGIFYSMQGIVSIFMPTLMGIVADKFIPAQKLLGICHGIAGAAMAAAGFCGMSAGLGADANVSFGVLFSLYAISVMFYMPTIALSNSVAFNILARNGYDTVKDFPPIRVFGTIGFICAMLLVNFLQTDIVKYVTPEGIEVMYQYQETYHQFLVSAVFGIVMFFYCFTLPECPVNKEADQDQTLAERFGLNAFSLFKDRQMAIFFIFSMLLGVALQITNGFANPFISHFKAVPEFADAWGARNANALISISQISETLGILLIPVAMKYLGIKKVMITAMLAWVLRFGLFGAGDPGPGVWMLIVSMIVYGVAFDFFNISGSLYVNMRTTSKIQNSAQGLFMLMTNGIGATIGTLSAQVVVNRFTESVVIDGNMYMVGDWSTAWYIFAGYALVVAILFAILFKTPKTEDKIA